MKSDEWKSYRTRFLVNAKQLNSSLSFVDHLGRQHCGQKGDYLVESSDGVISIAPRAIFEDIYVPMSQPPQPTDRSSVNQASLDHLKFEALEVEDIKLPKSAAGRSGHAILSNVGAAAVRRKLPQPFRDRRGSSQHMRLM